MLVDLKNQPRCPVVMTCTGTVTVPGGTIDRQVLEDAHLTQSSKDSQQEEYNSNTAHPQVDGP